MPLIDIRGVHNAAETIADFFMRVAVPAINRLEERVAALEQTLHERSRVRPALPEPERPIPPPVSVPYPVVPEGPPEGASTPVDDTPQSRRARRSKP